jgi:hypothetical protein
MKQEAVQKAASQHVDKLESKQRTSQGQPHDTEPVQSQGYSKYESHSTSQPRSGSVQHQGNSNMRPDQMAQQDRLQAQVTFCESNLGVKLLLSFQLLHKMGTLCFSQSLKLENLFNYYDIDIIDMI